MNKECEKSYAEYTFAKEGFGVLEKNLLRKHSKYEVLWKLKNESNCKSPYFSIDSIESKNLSLCGYLVESEYRRGSYMLTDKARKLLGLESIVSNMINSINYGEE